MVMPPPAISAPLRDYIERLKLEARVTPSKSLNKLTKPIDPIEAYAHQITSWISALPESQQKQAYGMASIIKLANLKGVYEESASPQQVAIALRQAGFRQKRSWKKADRNTRFWTYKN